MTCTLPASLVFVSSSPSSQSLSSLPLFVLVYISFDLCFSIRTPSLPSSLSPFLPLSLPPSLPSFLPPFLQRIFAESLLSAEDTGKSPTDPCVMELPVLEGVLAPSAPLSSLWPRHGPTHGKLI